MDRLTWVILFIGIMGIAAAFDAWYAVALVAGVVATLICIEAANAFFRDLDDIERK